MDAVALIFITALSVTLISTPFAKKLALKSGLLDQPASRKSHAKPIPLLGGLGLLLGTSAASVLVIALVTSAISPSVLGIAGASAFIALVGLADDRWSLHPLLKLLLEIVAAAILILSGVRVQLPIPELLNYAITILWIVGLTNAFNFLDNMDGLAAGVSAVASAFIMLIATQSGQYLVASLAAAIFGASLGFVRYNFKPATIFMGDTGSLLLGFVLAVLTLRLRFDAMPNFVTWMVPILIMGLPLFDTALVVVSRIRRKVNPFTTAGRDHTSHRLLLLKFSVREAVLILYLVCVAFGMSALMVISLAPLESYIFALAIALLAVVSIAYLERTYAKTQSSTEPQ